MPENTKVCVQVDLSDFGQNLQVCSLSGVDQLCKALEVLKGTLKLVYPSKMAEISHYLWVEKRVTPQRSVDEQAMNKTPSNQHCLTLEEFLAQYRLATLGSQKAKAITP